MGTGIHNAKVEGIKEGGELPRLCNFIAESAIRFLSKLSCRWRRGYRAHQQDALDDFIVTRRDAARQVAVFELQVPSHPFAPVCSDIRGKIGTRLP